MNFNFTTGRIIFGPGTLSEAGPVARSFGRTAMVITGRDVGRAAELVSILSRAGVQAECFASAGEPSIAVVKRIASQMFKCDLVIGFGGGSAIDCAKAVAALKTNGGDLLDYLEVIGRNQPLRSPALPCLAIPTTAGTGAEVTRNSVLASPEHKVKVSLRGPFLLPLVAIIDPNLTLTLPPRITAFTGMDALTQLIEPLTSNKAQPITDSFCREGLPRAARSLRVAFHEGVNAAAREEMCVASLLSGLALANAGLGAVHGLAGPIGGMFDAPHGALCAALLPHVMRVNQAALRARKKDGGAMRRYDETARLLTGRENARAEEGVAWVEALANELKIPGLKTYGISRSDFPAIIEKAERSSSMKANPIALSAEEMAEALTQAL